MKQLHLALGLAGAGVVSMFAAPAMAQQKSDDALTFKFEGSVGGEYSSNVAVQDLDTNTGEGDWAGTINLLAEAQLIPVDKLTLRAGLDLTQTLHNEFSEFDLTIARPYAEIAYDFDLLTVGVLGNYAAASLDGDEYLTYTQISPYVSKQFGNAFFLRLAYAKTSKEFEGEPAPALPPSPSNLFDRDAEADSVQVDGYIFLDGVKRYLVLGAKAAEEDADSDAFDYSSGLGRIRFVQRFDAMGREMTFRIGAEYEDRNYDSALSLIPPSGGATREDKRAVLDLDLEIPFGDHFFSEVSYKYGNYESNQPSADYDEHVAAIKFGVKY
ncbi:MAG TPA: hypothetical protein VGO52_25855 [Hyphomonadaceae bacterium]|jgi:hypothetical protein|nr:hypothetical protein [Hyphomonadaceae bacterium]